MSKHVVKVEGTDQAERGIKFDVLKALGGRKDLLIWNNPVGVFRSFDNPDRTIRIGVPGQADIFAVWNRRVELNGQVFFFGQMIAIETKTAKGRQSKAQKKWQAAFEARGGIYILARGTAEVHKLIGKSDAMAGVTKPEIANNGTRLLDFQGDKPARRVKRS